jgi:hypothetical protein
MPVRNVIVKFGPLAGTLLLMFAIAATDQTLASAAVPERQQQTADSATPAPLAECTDERAQLAPATSSLPVSLSAAQQAAGLLGNEGSPAIAVNMVALGNTPHHAPTTATIVVDGKEQPIASRPAWIYVLQNGSLLPAIGVHPLG